MNEYSRDSEAEPKDEEFESAVDEALEGRSRADELRAMKRVLVERRTRLTGDMDTTEDSDERERLRRALIKLDEQIAVLGEEAEITRFVEDAVRVGLEMRRLNN